MKRIVSQLDYPALVILTAIAVLMLAFTFLGDGLRDALDPRQVIRGERH